MRIAIVSAISIALFGLGGLGRAVAQPPALSTLETGQTSLTAEGGGLMHHVQRAPGGRGGAGGGRGGGGGGVSLGLGLAIPLIVDELNKNRRRPNRKKTSTEREPADPGARRPKKPKVRVAAPPPLDPPSVTRKPSRQVAKPPRPPVRPTLAPITPPETIAVGDNAPHRAREILVLINSGAGDDVRLGLMRDYNVLADPGRQIVLLDAQLLKLRLPDNRPLSELIAQLASDPRIVAANLNYVYSLMADKPAKSSAASRAAPLPYNLKAIKAPEAQRLALGKDVFVAVIDTCIDDKHAELRGVVDEAFDATDYPASPCLSTESHGTNMAGVIASQGAIKGIAHKSRILAAKAFGSVGRGKPAEATSESLIRAIDWAYGRNARVFNLSFAGPSDPLLKRLFERAMAKGVVLVAAAGNAGPQSPPLYPAAYDGVIAVSALGPSKEVFERSNRGSHITIAAPGVDILAPTPQGGYDISSGTSIAAAHISGIVALMLERKPDATPAELRSALMESAADLGRAGVDDDYGAGLADAEKAVRLLQSTTATTTANTEK